MSRSGKDVSMKKLLLVVIDALASDVMLPAMEQGQLPTMQALAQAGELHPACISVFPSITPAATAAIATGQYPSKHNILGAHWYNPETDDMIYYGYDFWVVWNQGLGKLFDDFLCKLNHQRLQSKTLFQIVEQAGYRAASLNYLIFKGDAEHTAVTPLPLSLVPTIPSYQKVCGPSIMYFGDLVNTKIKPLETSITTPRGFFKRFGFDDSNTAHLLLQLAKNGTMPDFTLAYFPDNDYRSHEVGPQAAVTVLKHIDQQLGQLIAQNGGLEQTLQQLSIVITGDHSQSNTLGPATAGINLDTLLSDFSIAEAGKPWGSDDQLVIGINMRTALIYFRSPTPNQLEQAVTQLLSDNRVDQVIWRARDTGQENKNGFLVATANRGRLHFWPGPGGPHTATDQYGTRWSWQGQLETVDGQLSDDNTLTFPQYPNALERISEGLNCKNSGHIWVTAKLGYEFLMAGINIHPNGGSHGSLHALDSTSPLLVAGLPAGLSLPEHPRTIDVAPLCLAAMGIQSPIARPVISG